MMDRQDAENPKRAHKSERVAKGMNPDSSEGDRDSLDTQDETDFRISTRLRRKSDEWQNNECQITSEEEEEPLSEEELESLDRYNMKHPKRGLALIFNHKKFYNGYQHPRLGAEEDGRVLEETLLELGFEVKLHNDKTSSEIKQLLGEAANKSHKDSDCFLVAFMTHGRKDGVLAAYDCGHKAEDVCNMFTSDKVNTLSGKPKIFLFQACRGKKVEESTVVFDSIDTVRPRPLTIPSHADFLVAHSSVEGYRSFRNQAKGSWFIQALCKDLKKSARERDLLSILTDTMRRVSYNRFSRTPKRPETDHKQQIPIVSSTLTRRLFFYDTKS